MNTIDDAIGVLAGRSVAVLTGAGVSTDSGIPDYRGEGTQRSTPMSFAQYLDGEENRRRYWAGSHLGWRRFSNAQPNRGHHALAKLEANGVVNGIVTQNVDGMHRRAGSARVVELHGTMSNVFCLQCSQHFAREAIARQLTDANPWLATSADAALRPDGDVDTSRLTGFTAPHCSICGGILKPDVVFFGELVPRARFRAAFDILKRADALLIAGSSLAVNSGIRLLDRAVRRELPVVIVNRGETKGDSRATVRLEGGTSEILAALAERL